ncbi:hypothetical protein JOF35_003043 [Streptomyces demainii]|uniref:Uncharacterized protein n=1 Tax=Streptomyces demainii TaxID=588122 RepID=A0ABT9KQR4_9ACTN|nr:hypothetical protein [Streptomyces demainii]
MTRGRVTRDRVARGHVTRGRVTHEPRRPGSVARAA